MSLGERIKQMRIEAELTQPELAVNAGIEQSYLSKLENDKASPSFDIINRVAIALGSDGKQLIKSLDLSYVQTKLAYLPEVAAETAMQHMQYRIWLKRCFILSGLLFVLGIGLVLTGGSKALFPEVAYNYVSNGVVLPGEPLELFNESVLFGESFENSKARLIKLKPRVDSVYLMSYQYRGDNFIENDGVGRRLFKLVGVKELSERSENSWLIVFGMMFLAAGACVMFYSRVVK